MFCAILWDFRNISRVRVKDWVNYDCSWYPVDFCVRFFLICVWKCLNVTRKKSEESKFPSFDNFRNTFLNILWVRRPWSSRRFIKQCIKRKFCSLQVEHHLRMIQKIQKSKTFWKKASKSPQNCQKARSFYIYLVSSWNKSKLLLKFSLNFTPKSREPILFQFDVFHAICIQFV